MDALKNGRIRAAALDATNPEPLPRDHPLLSLPNVVITPHAGSCTVQTRTRVMEQAVDNLKVGLKGKPMKGEITKETYHAFL